MDKYEILDQQCRDAVGLDESIAVLMRLLSDGYAVWDDGSLYSVKQLVANIKGLKIEVFSREHSPPHFHVSGNEIDAIFSISECLHLNGKVSCREKRLIEWWYQRSRDHLITAWNQGSPDDCNVEPFVE
jgi:hypothetical protein